MPKKKTNNTKFTFWIGAGLKAQAEAQAKKYNMSLSEYLRTLVVEDLQQ